MKKTTAILLIAIILNLKTNAQVNVITSFGAGIEMKNKAVPVQLTAGINFGQSEFVVGYTAFLHKNDAEFSAIIFARYGLSILQDTWEIMPLIGIGMHTATTYEVATQWDSVGDPGHIYDYFEQVRNPSKLNLLYGLKAHKSIGLGGIFASIEHCKYNYLNFGLFVRIGQPQSINIRKELKKILN